MQRSAAHLLHGPPAPSPRPAGRLLLVSFHFPPDGSAGALRWQRLAGLAAERGIGLDVVTAAPEEAGDPARLADLPADTRVFGVARRSLPIDRGEAWLRRRRRGGPSVQGATGGSAAAAHPASGSIVRWPIRAYDTWRMQARDRDWALRATAAAAVLLEPACHRALVSCGPPHAAHAAVAHLARVRGVPHVIDMRDPWSLVERLPDHLAPELWRSLARRAERRAVSGAALVVMNTAPARDAMQAAHPAQRARIISVMNGSDEAPLPTSAPPKCFRIAYLGTLYLDRDPTLLFRAVARVVRELELGPDALSVELMGHASEVRGAPTRDLAAAEGVADRLQLHPPGTHEQAMAFLAGSSLLVNLAQDSHMAVPSKLFEYLRFPAWVLALADPASATAQVLRDTRAYVVAPDDVAGIAGAIRDCYERHARGERPQPAGQGASLSRREQAALLFEHLDRWAPAPGSAP